MPKFAKDNSLKQIIKLVYVSRNALCQNCPSHSAPLNKIAVRAKNRNIFKLRLLLNHWIKLNMRGSKKFCQRGTKFDNFFFSILFLAHEGREDPNATVSVPPSARQGNAIEMAFCWRANDGPTLNAGFVALWFFSVSEQILFRNPIFLWFFRGFWTPYPSLSGSVHA